MLLIEHLLLKYFLPSNYPTPVLPLNRFSINHGNRFSIRNGQISQAHFHIFIWLVNVFQSQLIFLIGFQLNKSICSLEKCFSITEATNRFCSLVKYTLRKSLFSVAGENNKFLTLIFPAVLRPENFLLI